MLVVEIEARKILCAICGGKTLIIEWDLRERAYLVEPWVKMRFPVTVEAVYYLRKHRFVEEGAWSRQFFKRRNFAVFELTDRGRKFCKDSQVAK